jgi:hypothetical protein
MTKRRRPEHASSIFRQILVNALNEMEKAEILLCKHKSAGSSQNHDDDDHDVAAN